MYQRLPEAQFEAPRVYNMSQESHRRHQSIMSISSDSTITGQNYEKEAIRPMSEPLRDRLHPVISMSSDFAVTGDVHEGPGNEEAGPIEKIRREMAVGIIKGNWLSLLLAGGDNVTDNTKRNLDYLIYLTEYQLSDLRGQSTGEPGLAESIVVHAMAVGRLQEHRQAGTKFTYGTARKLAMEPDSFSRAETLEETKARTLKYRWLMRPVTEELNQVMISTTATPEERKEAIEKATLKRAEIHQNQRRENAFAKATMRRDGLSKELLGEDLFEMFVRQRNENVKASESNDELASLKEIEEYDW